MKSRRQHTVSARLGAYIQHVAIWSSVRHTNSIQDTTATHQRQTRSRGGRVNHSVLVIDDDPMLLELIQMQLEREGFAVITAANG